MFNSSLDLAGKLKATSDALQEAMGCTWSGLNALYDVVSSTSDVWLNDRRFRIVRQLGEGGYAFVYLVKEQPGGRPSKPPRDSSHVAGRPIVTRSSHFLLGLIKLNDSFSHLFDACLKSVAIV